MTNARVYVDNFETTIAEAVADTDTAFDITSATGLPTLSGGDFYYLTISNTGGDYEIIKVTARTSATLSTVVRAQDGTTAQNWSSGDKISMNFTASSLDLSTLISGKTLSTATVAADDKILIQDTSSSDSAKTVTAQAIADLAAGGGGLTEADILGTSGVTTVTDNLDGTVTIDIADNPTISGNAGIVIPAGTTGQRGSTDWQIRGNTSTFRPEIRIGGSWSGGQFIIDGDFGSTGLMRRTGSGTYDTVSTASGIDTFLVTPSSANLRAVLTDETGTGAAVFANSPTLVTPALGTAASGNITACSGAVVQTVITTYSTYANTTASIPWDNSIPQNTEGTEYITCSITPTSTTNKLIIEVNLQVYINTAGNVAVVALFQDSTANSLTARDFAPVGAQGLGPVAFTYVMDAGTTSSTTFKVRAGVTGGTLYIHGNATERKLGGVAISYLKITEIKP